MMVANKRPKGGPWYQRKSDGLWCAPIELGVVNGVRKRYVVTAATEAQVKKKYREAVVKKDAGTLITARSQSLSTWLDTWFTDIALKKIRPRTAAGYRSKIEKYIKPSIGHIRLDKLNADHIIELEDYIVKTLELSPTTALQTYRILAVALKYAERRKKITHNVTTQVDAPRKATGKLPVLTAADAFKALYVASESRLFSRWVAAFYTGARQGELLGLEIDRIRQYVDDEGEDAMEAELSWQLQRISWEHGCSPKCDRKRGTDCPKRKLSSPADWEHRHLEGGLYLARPKTKKAERTVQIVGPAMKAVLIRLEQVKAEPNPHGLLWTADRKYSKGGIHAARELLPLDGSPIDPSRDNKAWHDILMRAGLPSAPLHAARHTSASLLGAAGVSPTIIQSILGHSTFAMSQNYMDVDRKQIADGMKALSALIPIAQINASDHK